MHRVIRRPISFVLVLLFASALLPGGPASAAPSPGRAPFLAAAVAAPGAIAIRGSGFTPGGRVYVALYDLWGAKLHQTRWTTASPALSGPDGSQDPAAGYRPGGIVSERFDGLCGATLMARAYDETTQTWSAALDVDTSAFGAAVYGPDGSQDPALGYRPAC
jgi:hypothetical protein